MGLMVLQVRPTLTRFPTNIHYTLVENIHFAFYTKCATAVPTKSYSGTDSFTSNPIVDTLHVTKAMPVNMVTTWSLLTYGVEC